MPRVSEDKQQSAKKDLNQIDQENTSQEKDWEQGKKVILERKKQFKEGGFKSIDGI